MHKQVDASDLFTVVISHGKQLGVIGIVFKNWILLCTNHIAIIQLTTFGFVVSTTTNN